LSQSKSIKLAPSGKAFTFEDVDKGLCDWEEFFKSGTKESLLNQGIPEDIVDDEVNKILGDIDWDLINLPREALSESQRKYLDEIESVPFEELLKHQC